MLKRRIDTLICLCATLLAACGGGGGGGGGNGGTPPPSEADRFFVRAAAGDDGNSGTTAGEAFKTIGAAVSRLTDGDTVIVGPGTYTEAIIDPRSGTAGNPIVLRADPTGASTGDAGGAVVLDVSEVHDANNRPLPGIRLSAAQFVEVDGFSVRGAGPAGIQLRARGTDPVVHSTNVTIRNCEVSDSQDGADGILIQDSSDILLFNNQVYRNDRRGIVIAGSPRVSLINNTISDNGDRGIFATDRNMVASTDLFLRNNISQSNGAPGSDGSRRRNIQIDPGPPSSIDGFDSQHNLIFPAGYQPTDLPHPTDINADALFVAPNSDNFRLSQTAGGQSQTSPALNVGVEESAPDSPAVDFESLRSRATASNGTVDAGPIDLGYHAPPEQVEEGGVTWYVRQSGDDNAIGNRVTRALRTIGEAASRAGAGDRIVVGPGTYAESIDNLPSGSADRPIVLFADAKGDLTADPAADVVVGVRNALAAFRLTSVEFVVIDGFVLTQGAEAGISIRTGSGNVTVRNCVIRDNETGILVLSSDDVLLFDNLVTANHQLGVDVRGAGRLDGIRLVNNTVARNDRVGINIGERSTTVEVLVQNNIVQGNPDGNLEVNDASEETVTLRHNLVFPDSYSPASLDHSTDVNEDADFVGPSDFHVSGSSPAIDAGDPGTNSSLATDLGMRSTTSNGAADTGPLDLGYHFPR